MVPQPNYDPMGIRQVVENTSGYPFELQITRRIEKWRDYEYFVEPNYSFEDQDSGEARELDFHAIRAVPISTERNEYAYVVILGSCKASRNPYIFFTRPGQLAGVMLMSDVPISGCPLDMYEENGEIEAIESYFELHRFLHIGEVDNISSQACILSWKGTKWEVQSEATIRDIFVPLVKVMSREIEDHNNECIPSGEEAVVEYRMYYPLLVLKGPMYEYYVPAKGDPELKTTNHVLVIRHYESKSVKCRFAIDVIHESYLERYLDLLEREAKKFVNLVIHHKKIVARSVEQLAREEKKEGSKGRG
jgi:hypothetical protein